MQIDFLSELHKSTKRDYLGRVNDKEFPKALAASKAKEWGFDYWDGDRRICYGGYNYIPDRWKPVAEKLISHYKLKDGSKLLDIGCGKGFLLYEIKKINPKIEVRGLDISSYALKNSKKEIRSFLDLGNANNLPYEDKSFDLVFSINTFHNLHVFDLNKALREISRVSRGNSYVCVESYRNEEEKANLLYWQVTCEAFNTPDEWKWWFNLCNYNGDYSFIYFE